MDVIRVAPWSEGGKTPEVDDMVDNKFFFGLRDLTSDYYQVMIEGSRPRWCRIFWMFLITGLIGFTVYCAYLMVSDFLSFGSYDAYTTVTDATTLVLPAITLCSLNYMNYTRFTSDVGEDSAVSRQLNTLLYEAAMVSDPILLNLDLDDYLNLTNYEDHEGSIGYTYRNHIYDFISSASHDYKLGKTHQLVTDWITESGATQLGACIEINDNLTMSQTLKGSGYGLTFDLDANIASYLPGTETQGFKVFIRNHDETIILNEGGYVVAPGTETFMKLELSEITRLGSPYGSCNDKISTLSKYGLVMQTTRECWQAAKLERMINECECIPWYFAERLMNLGKYALLDSYVSLANSTSWVEDWDTDYYDENYGDYDDSYHRRRRSLNNLKKRGLASLKKKRSLATLKREKSRAKRAARDARQADDSGGNVTNSGNITNSGNATEDWEYWDYEDAYGEEDWYDDYDDYDDYMTTGEYSDYYCTIFEQVDCDTTFSAMWQIMKSDYECDEPCSYHKYDVTVTSTPFPSSEDYFDSYIKFNSWKNPDSYTYDYAKENMVRLHIYYDEILYKEITQTKDYEIQNFIGELGGTVDLFIGFSFFTVFQLIEIAIAYSVMKCCSRRNKNDEEKNNIHA